VSYSALISLWHRGNLNRRPLPCCCSSGTQAQSLILINKNNQVPLPDPKDKLKTEDGKPLGYMVLSEDPQDWETLISRATSFSCAVGR